MLSGRVAKKLKLAVIGARPGIGARPEIGARLGIGVRLGIRVRSEATDLQ